MAEHRPDATSSADDYDFPRLCTFSGDPTGSRSHLPTTADDPRPRRFWPADAKKVSPKTALKKQKGLTVCVCEQCAPRIQGAETVGRSFDTVGFSVPEDTVKTCREISLVQTSAHKVLPFCILGG